MNDYKELIDILNDVDFADCSEHCFLPCSGSGSCFVLKAADIIEQLIKERDEAIENIPKSCSKCAHSQDGYARVLADGKTDGFCLTCISNRRCNFKWRGVTE